MELHVVLPNESAAMEPHRIAELAQQAEGLGYDAVWLPDHLLPPADYGATYGGVYEPLVTLSYVAATTSRIRLGTSVLVLPMRSPFAVAKQAATLDRLSGGRFVLGVGIGWDRQEFASVGVDFAARGARTDEAIRLLRHLFDTGEGPFDSPHYGFRHGVFAPRPHHVPILVGGMSDAALRRAARLADIWQSVPTPPEQFAERVGALRELTDRPIEVGARMAWRDPLADMIDDAHAFAAAGADHLAVSFGEHEEAGRRMAAFAAALRRPAQEARLFH